MRVALSSIALWAAFGLTASSVLAQADRDSQNRRHNEQPAPAQQPGDPQEPKPEQAGPAPKIQIDVAELDLGRITDENPVSGTVHFRNVGEGDLVVQDITGSCGCTVPSLDQLEKKVYKPGEAGSITVTFHPQGKHDQQHTVVRVHTNDPVSPTRNYQVLVYVDPLLRVSPGVGAFQTLRRGEKQSLLLTVRGLKEDFEITELLVNAGEHVTGQILFEEEIEEAGRVFHESTIEVAYDGLAKPGPIRGNVTIRTNDPRRSQMTVPIAGYVLGDIECDTIRWPLGNQLTTDQVLTHTIRLRARSGEPFNVTEVVDRYGRTDYPLEWEVIDVEPGVKDLKVTVTTNSRPGAMRGTIGIVTDIPDEPEISIPYFGAVQPNR